MQHEINDKLKLFKDFPGHALNTRPSFFHRRLDLGHRQHESMLTTVT